MFPQKRYVEVLTPVPVNVTLFGNRVFAHGIKLKGGHPGLGWALNPKTGTLLKRKIRQVDKRKRRHTGKKATLKTGRDEIHAATNQGTLRLASSHQS